MNSSKQKIKRAIRVRSKLAKNIGLPRLTVFRSNRHIWTQIIDDKHGKTLVSASSKSLESTESTKTPKSKNQQAIAVGKQIAKVALKANIKRVRFDRGHNLYHGRIKSLADAARQKGLLF